MSQTFSATAVVTGPPPKVVPCSPHVEQPLTFVGMRTADERQPARERLGQRDDVGLEPHALRREEGRPCGQRPVCTSSAIRIASCFRHSSFRAAGELGGHGCQPALALDHLDDHPRERRRSSVRLEGGRVVVGGTDDSRARGAGTGPGTSPFGVQESAPMVRPWNALREAEQPVVAGALGAQWRTAARTSAPPRSPRCRCCRRTRRRRGRGRRDHGPGQREGRLVGEEVRDVAEPPHLP